MFTKYLKNSSIITVVIMLAGCVSVPNPDPNDPLESYNRTMFKVNESIDKAVLKPVATGYRAVAPKPVRTCVSNIFGNLGDVWSGVNSMLQGRGLDAVNTFGRVLFNSTVGLGGCIDVATMNGAYRIPNDFGTTLAVWGVGQGSYVVLPILGPSTMRDAVGKGADGVGSTAIYVSPWSIENVTLRNGVVVLEGVDARTQLLDADDMATTLSIDKYSFVRDAYLQNRNALIRKKLGPQITDGTKVERWSSKDTQFKKGASPFAKPVFNGYLPTTSDPQDANNVPQYDDPDSANSSTQAPNVPQYDDPESDNGTKQAGTKQAQEVPQYDDPDSVKGVK